jgi:hypothetical protein
MPPHVAKSTGKPPNLPSILTAAVVMLALAACTGDLERAERFPYIHEPNFKIENPSRDHASATGIGCGGTEKEALMEARITARFNLRGVSGNGNYKIRYLLLREIPKDEKFCVEVKATAFDPA